MFYLVRSPDAAGAGSKLRMAALPSGLVMLDPKCPMCRRASRWWLESNRSQSCMISAVHAPTALSSQHTSWRRGTPCAPGAEPASKDHLRTVRSIGQLHTDLGQVRRCQALCPGLRDSTPRVLHNRHSNSPGCPCSGCVVMQTPDTCHERSKMLCHSHGCGRCGL